MSSILDIFITLSLYWDPNCDPLSNPIDDDLAKSMISEFPKSISNFVMELFENAICTKPVIDSNGNRINGRLRDIYNRIGEMTVEFFCGQSTSFERHDWIQTFFPTKTPSQFNKGSFLWKDMRGFLSTDCGGKIYDMCLRIVLRYYGMDWDDKMNFFTLNGRSYLGGHHNLRVSRILESLRLMAEFNLKYRNVRRQLYLFLRENKRVGEISRSYWEAEMRESF